jgi:hypothetical protein
VLRVGPAVSGSLRVGAEQCLGLVDVSALLSAFHQRHPGIATEFAQAGSHELVGAVREGELDVAFVATDRHLGALRHTFLGGEPLVLVVPPDHPLARRTTLRWEMLDGADFVDFSETWGVRTMNDDLLATHGVHRRVRCSVNDVHTLLDLVTSGLGVAIVPAHVARKPQAASLLTRELPGAAQPSWSVSAISPLAPSADVPSAARPARGDGACEGACGASAPDEQALRDGASASLGRRAGRDGRARRCGATRGASPSEGGPSRSLREGRGEGPAVLAGGGAERAAEVEPQVRPGAQARAHSDLIDGQVAVLEQAARHVHAGLEDPAVRRAPGLLDEAALEGPPRHRCPVGQLLRG